MKNQTNNNNKPLVPYTLEEVDVCQANNVELNQNKYDEKDNLSNLYNSINWSL